nr:PorT family protein [Bacteroidota bacterium]
MKRIIICVMVLMATQLVQSQSMMIGVKGAYNTTWLMNKNIFDQGDELDPDASFAPSYGVNGIFYFNDNLGLAIEANVNKITQKYSGVILDSITWEGSDKLTYMEIPLLLHLANKGGMYFEIGPKVSFLTGATGAIETTPSFISDYNERTIKKGFNKTMFSLVFGFGVNVRASDLVYVIAGLRFSGSFTDATKEYSKEEFAKAEDIGITDSFAHIKQDGIFKYENTTAVTGGIMLGIGFNLSNKAK